MPHLYRHALAYTAQSCGVDLLTLLVEGSREGLAQGEILQSWQEGGKGRMQPGSGWTSIQISPLAKVLIHRWKPNPALICWSKLSSTGHQSSTWNFNREIPKLRFIKRKLKLHPCKQAPGVFLSGSFIQEQCRVLSSLQCCVFMASNLAN